MTEAEWQASADLASMLELVRPKAGDRKLRLFACGCCRRVSRFMPDKRSRTALAVAERFADGLASEAERQAAVSPTWHIPHDHSRWTLMPDVAAAAHEAMVAAGRAVYRHSSQRQRHTALNGEHPSQAALLRDIVGNPFRPVAFDPRWRTADTVGLARAIYEDRAIERIPLLADALMDAGCADEQVIWHCRGDGPHVRGCWVVDLVLGKE
jgi:hypothetical protein